MIDCAALTSSFSGEGGGVVVVVVVVVVIFFAVVVDFCFRFVKSSVEKNKKQKTPTSDGPSCSVIIRLHGIYLNSTPNWPEKPDASLKSIHN